MKFPLYILIGYLVLINIIAFAAYAIDKRRAVLDMWRIPEARLLALAAAGGSAGALLSMRLFRHKTKHPRFSIGVPMMLFVHMALLAYVLRRFF